MKEKSQLLGMYEYNPQAGFFAEPFLIFILLRETALFQFSGLFHQPFINRFVNLFHQKN